MQYLRDHGNDTGIPLVELKIRHMKVQLLVTLFIMCITAVKIIHALAHTYTKYLPESNMLLICGILLKLIIQQSEYDAAFDFINETMFFFVLLPPIILEASLSMYNKAFASNLLSVLIFAVLGTLANFFLIGFSLQIICEHYYIYIDSKILRVDQMKYGAIWIFASLIVAVDPVAVLAIFQEIHVETNLYYLVFGESLLNDGVSVVLYEVMQKLVKQHSIETVMILKSVVLFFFVCIGGAIIGIVISVITCLITRFTPKTPLSEPLIVIFFGYLAYILADTLSWSGIISMITFGVIQAAYGFQNITQKSLIVTKRLIKIVANLTESIIFIYIGMEIVSRAKTFLRHSEFILWSIFLCVYFRYVVTLLLVGMINYFKLNIRNIQWNELFIISYGGLRGGIAYCLAKLTQNELILDATLFMVFYTIVFMGFTMKPLVTLLSIKIDKPEELSLFVKINESVIGNLLAGIEDLIGFKGQNSWYRIFKSIEEKYIRKLLQRDAISNDEKIMKTFEKMNLAMHMATTAPPGSTNAEYYRNKLKPTLRKNLPRTTSFQSIDTEMSHTHLDEQGKNPSIIFEAMRRIGTEDNLAKRISMMLSRKSKTLQITKNVRKRMSRFDSEISSIDVNSVNTPSMLVRSFSRRSTGFLPKKRSK